MTNYNLDLDLNLNLDLSKSYCNFGLVHTMPDKF